MVTEFKGGSKEAYDSSFELHPEKRRYWVFDEDEQTYKYYEED